MLVLSLLSVLSTTVVYLLLPGEVSRWRGYSFPLISVFEHTKKFHDFCDAAYHDPTLGVYCVGPLTHASRYIETTSYCIARDDYNNMAVFMYYSSWLPRHKPCDL